MHQFDPSAFATQYCDWSYNDLIPLLGEFGAYSNRLPVLSETPGIGAILNEDFFKELITGAKSPSYD